MPSILIIPAHPIRHAFGVAAGAAVGIGTLHFLGASRDLLSGLIAGTLIATIGFVLVCLVANAWTRSR